MSDRNMSDRKWMLRTLVATMSSDDTKPNLQHILVKDYRAITCNGYSLFSTDTDNPDGLYAATKDMIVKNVDDISIYPNVVSVIPKIDGYISTRVTIPSIKHVRKGQTRISYDHERGDWLLESPRDKLLHFNLDLLQPIVGRELTMWTRGPLESVLFESGGEFTKSYWYLLVMPRRR